MSTDTKSSDEIFLRRFLVIFFTVAFTFLGLVAAAMIRERVLWPVPSDRKKAGGIPEFVADHFSFTQKSTWRTNLPPIYIDMSSWLAHPTVVVYTITDKQQQDKILTLVQRYKEQEGLGTILVEFYREEHWTPSGRPPNRPENLLRSERLR
ncbi:MAG: hypothetical protein ACLP0A_10335 [Verrucomicrobiia bacterium]